MIEELVNVESEVRVLTIFGQVVGAASDDNKNIKITLDMEQAAVALASEARADCFRCDFFILRNQQFVLNECCSFLWPSDNFFAMEVYDNAYQILITNYNKLVSPMHEIVPVDQYVWRVTQNYASCGIGDPRYMTLTCNFYIVIGTEKIVFIDTGCDKDIFSVLNVLGNMHYEKDVICIFTHWHDDHILGLKSIPDEDKYITVFAHPEDAGKLTFEAQNISINHVVDGDKISVGNINFEVHSTPGHTKGSISVRSDKGHIFTGDAFNIGRDLMFISDINAFVR